MKTFAFIDGFNVYHAIDHVLVYHKYKWLDYRRLIELFLLSTDQLDEVLYFTTPSKWSVLKRARQSVYIDALKSRRINVIEGEFYRVTRRCRKCDKPYKAWSEKMTDVNLASHLIKMGVKDDYEKAIVVTSDTDVVPAIRAIMDLKPAKVIEVLYPIGRSNKSIDKLPIKKHHMGERQLAASILPERVDLGGGNYALKPTTWGDNDPSILEKFSWYLKNIRRETEA